MVAATSALAQMRLTDQQKNRDRDRILDALFRSLAGLTDEELQTATGIGGNTERPRRRELDKEGRIVWDGRTRPTKSGAQAKVWTVRL